MLSFKRNEWTVGVVWGWTCSQLQMAKHILTHTFSWSFYDPCATFPKKWLLSSKATFASPDEKKKQNTTFGCCGPHLSSQLLGRMRQEDLEFKVGNLVRPHLKETKLIQYTTINSDCKSVFISLLVQRDYGVRALKTENKKKQWLVKWRAKLSYL